MKVLFICTGNSARSQMAEAFLKKYGEDKFEAHSCGLLAKGIHPLTYQVMEEIGFDLSDQYSKDASVYLGKVNFGYLITVCDEAEKNCPSSFLGISNREHWSFEDPAAFEGTDEQKLEKFREIRDEIEAKIKQFVQENN
jgi:arsenate reductase